MTAPTTRLIPAIAITAATLALAGCTSTQAPPLPPTSAQGIPPTLSPQIAPHSAEQAEALADASVTFEEYQAGFDRFKRCAADHGHEVTYISTTGNVFDYAMSPQSAESPEVLECYQLEFEGVDIAWQISNDDVSETSQQMARCLEQWGLTVPNTMAERMQALDAKGIDPMTCDKV